MKYLITLLIAFPSLAFAQAEGEQSFLEAAISIQSFIGLFYVASFIVGATILLSIVSTLADFDKFKQRAENPARQLAIRFVIAGILMNPSTSVMVMSETLGFSVSNDNQFCFAYNLKPNPTEGGVVTDGSTRQCYESAATNLQKALKEKHTEEKTKKTTKTHRNKTHMSTQTKIEVYFMILTNLMKKRNDER